MTSVTPSPASPSPRALDAVQTARLTALQATIAQHLDHLYRSEEGVPWTSDHLALELRQLRPSRIAAMIAALDAAGESFAILDHTEDPAPWFALADQLGQILFHAREPFRHPILLQLEGLGPALRRLAPRTYESARQRLTARLTTFRAALPRVTEITGEPGPPGVLRALVSVMRGGTDYSRRLLAIPLSRFGPSREIEALSYSDRLGSDHEAMTRDLTDTLILGCRAMTAPEVMAACPRPAIRAAFAWLREIDREGYGQDMLRGICQSFPVLECVDRHIRTIEWEDRYLRRSVAFTLCETEVLESPSSEAKARKLDPTLAPAAERAKVRHAVARHLAPWLTEFRNELKGDGHIRCFDRIEQLARETR